MLLIGRVNLLRTTIQFAPLYRGCTRDPRLESKGNQGLPLKTTLGSKQLEYFQLDRLITLAVDQFI